MNLIDRSTVENLELRTPGLLNNNKKEILEALNKQIIFSKAPTETVSVIREFLVTICALISSLYTFLKDIKFIRSCVKLLRSLNNQPLKKFLQSILR